MQPRISMITLGVSDLQKSISFYKDGLGFPQLDSPPTVAFFTLDGSWLGLFPRDELARDANVPGAGSGFNSFALAHNVASEDEVDQVIAEALLAGATLAKEGQKVFWGGYSGYFKDPDGHLWEVAHNPFAWVGLKDADDISEATSGD
jgi:catechol 2,3-dioxygenase-like lactoylglutathione lyase family enzyme